MSSDPFFKPIGQHVDDTPTSGDAAAAPGAEGAEPRMVEEIESLCMACHEQGVTRLLLTYIPYFKEVIVASFSCEHCGARNNEIQSAGQIQDKGILYTVHCNTTEDLDRQIVKSEWATLQIPELDLTIPASRGQLTTIEGIVSDTLRDLEMGQPLRKHTAPEAYAKIEELCTRLRDILGEEAGAEAAAAAPSDKPAQTEAWSGPIGKSGAQAKADRTFAPFSLRIEDPSGNSFIEFRGDIKQLGAGDNKWSKRDFPRTREQNELIGLAQPAGETAAGPGGLAAVTEDEEMGGGFSKKKGETEFDNEEVYSFDGVCTSCSAPLKTLMKKVNIPYFKDIIIMSTNCENCGYRDNEVKSGTAISDKGRRLTLRVEDAEDLSRDMLKSDTAGLSIPEIDLHLQPGTLGGRFTTLEGLLQQVYDELSTRLMRGDSASREDANKFDSFLGRLKGAMSASACPYTVILDDPLNNSYIQNPYAPDVDEQVTSEEYERTWDQNEDLGINDMRLVGYNPEAEGMEAGAAKEAREAEARQRPDGEESEAKRQRQEKAAPPGIGKGLIPLDDKEMTDA